MKNILPDTNEDHGHDEGDEGERVRQHVSIVHQDVAVQIESLQKLNWALYTCAG